MKVVLIHGKDADPSMKWYPWLKREVEKKGIEFIAPRLPHADDPRLDEWLKEINKSQPDEHTILVGHSRGGLAILRWLEDLPKNRKVKKVILVAANNPSICGKNKTKSTNGFYEKGALVFEEIKKHCDNFVVIHSKDDLGFLSLTEKKTQKGLRQNLRFTRVNYILEKS